MKNDIFRLLNEQIAKLLGNTFDIFENLLID